MRLGLSPSLHLSLLTKPLRHFRRHWWVSALLWMIMMAPAQAALVLRVAIEESVSQVKVGSSTSAVLRDGAGRTLGELQGMSGFLAKSTGGGVALSRWQADQISIEPTGDGYVYIGDRWYRGRTLIVPTEGGLTAINAVDLEQYLYSVLGAEMSPSWPLEALKAQAVAARSYALYQREHRGNSVYDVGDTAGWQVYKGLETEGAGTYAAVDSTAGQVLTYESQIIEAVFHSSSGGHTENVEDVWTEPRAYLRGVPDYDRGAPVYEWTKTFSRAELSQLISGVGNVISLTPERTSPTGRIITMRVVGDAAQRVISGNELRQLLDLRSTQFSVTSSSTGSKGNNSGSGSFIVNGRGFGHGIGLSQWGAYNLAQQGVNYQQILLHYYQNSYLAVLKVQ